MSKHRAVVFDLDGTAVPNVKDGMPSPALVRAVADVRADLHLVAATGRPPAMALPILRALGLTDPCVVSGGTTVISPVSGGVIRKVFFSDDQLAAVLAINSDHSFDVEVDGTYVPDRKYLKAEVHSPASIVAFSPILDHDLPDVLESLDAIPGVVAVSTSYWRPDHAIHVTPADGSKEYGIRHVLEQLDVAPHDAVGVGDGDNDLHLFASVGYRIAMGNASKTLKAAADEVVGSVDEDGLIEAIYKCVDQH